MTEIQQEYYTEERARFGLCLRARPVFRPGEGKQIPAVRRVDKDFRKNSGFFALFFDNHDRMPCKYRKIRATPRPYFFIR